MADSALDPALTSNEQIALNNGFQSVYGYLSVVPPTVHATALVNQTMSPSQYPLKHIPVDTTSANWLTSEAGQTIDITNAAGTVLRGTYRLRRAPNSNTIFIGEIGNGDWGLLNELNRANVGGSTVIQDNDKITVYANRFDLWSAAPEIIYPPGTFYEDAFAYSEWTAQFGSIASGYPIVNIGPHRSQFVDFGQSYATMTFTANAIAWSLIGPTPTYSWTIPGTWTVTSGSSSTQSFTARVPAGFHTLRCTVTMVSPEGTAGTTALRCVWAHNRGSHIYLMPISQITSDIRDRTGRTMTIRLPGNLIDGQPFILQSLTYGAMVNYFEEPSFYIFDVPTVTKNFTGWVTNRRLVSSYNSTEWEIEITGPAGMLDRLGSYSQWIERNATPTTFQQVKAGNCTIPYVMWYLLRLRAPNLLKLFDHHPFSTSQTVGNLLNITAAASSSLLGQMQELAKDIGCNYGHDSRGAGWVRAMPSLVRDSSRSTYCVIRDILTTGKFTVRRVTREEKPKVRRVRCGQIYYDSGGSGVDVALQFDAPGDAPGQGVADEEVVLAGLSDFGAVGGDIYAGNVYANRNNPLPTFTVEVPGDRDVLEPAQGPRVDISAAIPLIGADQSTRYATPLRITKRLDGKGGCMMDWELEGETTGVPGTEVA